MHNKQINFIRKATNTRVLLYLCLYFQINVKSLSKPELKLTLNIIIARIIFLILILLYNAPIIEPTG